MKVLDFGSGSKEHALELWQPNSGIAVLRKMIQKRSREMLEIHCLDPLEIHGSESVEGRHAEFHFYQDFEKIPDGIDIICALHPSPGTIQAYSRQGIEADLQDGWYPGILGSMIREKLKPGGKIIFQFDDQLEEAQGGRGGEILLKQVEAEAYFRTPQTHFRRRPDLVEVIEIFPNSTYTFSSLHVFDKIAT